LIQASAGGTAIQLWTPREAFAASPNPDLAAYQNGEKVGILYDGMIHPVIPYGIKGAIWYQGEANTYHGFLYRSLLPTLIQSWRERWKQGDFPFLIVQLAPHKKIVPQPGESNWAELREAQLLTTLHDKNSGLAVITDVGDEENIHPKQKQPVGARLA